MDRGGFMLAHGLPTGVRNAVVVPGERRRFRDGQVRFGPVRTHFSLNREPRVRFKPTVWPNLNPEPRFEPILNLVISVVKCRLVPNLAEPTARFGSKPVFAEPEPRTAVQFGPVQVQTTFLNRTCPTR